MKKWRLDEQNSINPNSSFLWPKTKMEKPTKAQVGSLSGNDRKRRDMSTVFGDQDNEFDKNKFNIIDCVTVNRNPTSDNELSNKKDVDDQLTN